MSFKNISTVILKARNKKNISQAKLAGIIKDKRYAQMICNIERGLCSVPVSMIVKFSDALDIKPSKIILAKAKDYEERLYNESNVNRSRNDRLNTMDTRSIVSRSSDRRGWEKGRRL